MYLSNFQGVTLECFACTKEYKHHESDAPTKYMFCSKECEASEDNKLKEGNEIVEKAQIENPSLNQNLHEINMKNSDVSTLLRFVKGEQNK